MGLYAGLQAFFAAHAALQRRPFFAAGESYAGKFVPSLGAPECGGACGSGASFASSGAGRPIVVYNPVHTRRSSTPLCSLWAPTACMRAL